jgi:hypothetical protein
MTIDDFGVQHYFSMGMPPQPHVVPPPAHQAAPSDNSDIVEMLQKHAQSHTIYNKLGNHAMKMAAKMTAGDKPQGLGNKIVANTVGKVWDKYNNKNMAIRERYKSYHDTLHNTDLGKTVKNAAYGLADQTIADGIDKWMKK